MPFEPTDLALIDQSREVLIETQSGDRTNPTIIWIVVDDGEVFIRSVRGQAGKWYRRVQANADVAILVNDRRIPARAVPASDQDSVERTNNALRRKYPASMSLESMLHPDVLGTTMRLDPL